MNAGRRTRDGHEDPGWQQHAACRGEDPDLWFAPASDPVSTEEALQICTDCPVRVDCLSFILRFEYLAALKDRSGIWGATTPEERYTAAVEWVAAKRREVAA